MLLTLSYLLVAAQVLLLGGLAFSTDWTEPGWWVAAAVAGVILGLWALAAMRLRHLRIMPEVHPEGRLVRHGPYRWLRHPMYTSVLLFSAGMVGQDPRPLRLALGLALLVVLLLKLHREEKLLAEAYPEYAAYQKTTWRLAPYIW